MYRPCLIFGSGLPAADALNGEVTRRLMGGPYETKATNHLSVALAVQLLWRRWSSTLLMISPRRATPIFTIIRR